MFASEATEAGSDWHVLLAQKGIQVYRVSQVLRQRTLGMEPTP